MMLPALCLLLPPLQDDLGATTPSELFVTAETCALCHSASPDADALRGADGQDVSPHGLWSGTLMANSFRDPIFRAQLAREVETHPEQAAEIEGLCLRCHTPMALREAEQRGLPTPRLSELVEHPFALDGVSCTVCHQAQPDNFGQDESFDGRLIIRPEQTIFGPYPEPFTGPMLRFTGYTPTGSAHVMESALCGTCHTLTTAHTGQAFLEQGPYLEWRNSVYSTEPERGEESRSCGDCHMANVGAMHIARNPGGFDFPFLEDRPDVYAHAFVGGNAMVLDLFREHREELGVTATDLSLETLALTTRHQLANDTADLALEQLRRTATGVAFQVVVTNRTGHKFPTGYPARRAWLRARVLDAEGEVLVASGEVDGQGRLVGVAKPLELPHRDRISAPDQVQVYELVADGIDGQPTTSLLEMARPRKDNRLLPKGWRADGPEVKRTGPAGVEGDDDFVGGGDRVDYELPLAAGASGSLTIEVTLLYQVLPPVWTDALANSQREEPKRLLRLLKGQQRTETIGQVRAKIE